MIYLEVVEIRQLKRKLNDIEHSKSKYTFRAKRIKEIKDKIAYLEMKYKNRGKLIKKDMI